MKIRSRHVLWCGPLACALLALGAAADAPKLNGFEISRHQVDREKIIAGGPPRDGIRSVDEPEFVDPGEASWVDDSTPVLGVALGGEARAYPVHVIERHQIANDTLSGVPIAVTYDPLAGAPLAYRRRVEGRTLTFGVSGLLYNSNFLMYDRETDSLWSQFLGKAISGPLAGKTLEPVELRQETMGSWYARQPSTRVLARPEPRRIDYRYSPFEKYWVQDAAPFPVEAKDRRFHAKELVLGAVVGGKSRAYLGSILTARGGRAEDRIDGATIRVEYSTDLGLFRWEVSPGVRIVEAYWFAWKAFHPDTEIWQDPGRVEGRNP